MYLNELFIYTQEDYEILLYFISSSRNNQTLEHQLLMC